MILVCHCISFIAHSIFSLLFRNTVDKWFFEILRFFLSTFRFYPTKYWYIFCSFAYQQVSHTVLKIVRCAWENSDVSSSVQDFHRLHFEIVTSAAASIPKEVRAYPQRGSGPFSQVHLERGLRLDLVTSLLCRKFTGHRWIPLTKAIDAELWCFLWSAPWINGWVNNRVAGDFRRPWAHHDVIVMILLKSFFFRFINFIYSNRGRAGKRNNEILGSGS